MSKTLRVLNAVRSLEIGIPLCIQQYKEVVIMHWACSKLTVSSAIPDPTLLEFYLTRKRKMENKHRKSICLIGSRNFIRFNTYQQQEAFIEAQVISRVESQLEDVRSEMREEMKKIFNKHQNVLLNTR
nr:protein vacuoleless1 [Tanacetum cinerariifolium]